MITISPFETYMMHAGTLNFLHKQHLSGSLQKPERMGSTELSIVKMVNNPKKTEGFVLTIPIIGLIGRYGDRSSRGYEDIVDLIKEYNYTDDIKLCILELDGPGGEANGTRELYLALKNSKKPVYAFIKGMAASAHYYIAAGCKEIYCESNTSKVGSIGALAIIEHTTNPNIRYEILRARGSENKVKQNSIEPITDEIRKEVIDGITEMRDLFVADVNETRKVNIEATTGNVYMAQMAKSYGLIDGIKNKQEFLKYLTKKI
jgi:ClpP class serine protease